MPLDRFGPLTRRVPSQDLLAVASEALPFSTDEDGPDSSGVNPMASVFDLGKEPMDYWEDRVSAFSLSLPSSSPPFRRAPCWFVHTF